MPVEYRYLLKPTQTVNGLTAKQLSVDPQSGVYESIATSKGSSATTVYIGIRVWKRSSAGVETEITGGTPVAQASSTVDRSPTPPVSVTWVCPLTTLVSTDSIVVRWYTRFDALSWVLLQTCTTEQLGADSLNNTTWTVTYYWQILDIKVNATSVLWYDGDFETLDYYPTAISNFSWTPYVPPVVWGGSALPQVEMACTSFVLNNLCSVAAGIIIWYFMF